MARFRKKPVVIEARKYVDDAVMGSNSRDIVAWIISEAGVGNSYTRNGFLFIKTLESGDGYHQATLGDWIIKGVNGEFYPCKPDIFEKTYEAVEGENG